MQHLGGHGPQQESSKRTIAVSRHHDQVSLLFMSAVDDLSHGIPFRYTGAHAPAGKLLRGEAAEYGVSLCLKPINL